MKLQWKVCGMKYAENIRQVLELGPDFMGFIFYEKSPRYVGDQWEGPGTDFPVSTKKVGVFVNESLETITRQADRFDFTYLQLHGEESPQYCRALTEKGFDLIKARSFGESQHLSSVEDYKPWVKYFLFDTPTNKYGGTGSTFDWTLLKPYDNQVPIFLSGGISNDNIMGVRELRDLNLAVVDINSRFEIKPALKDISMIQSFKNQLQQL